MSFRINYHHLYILNTLLESFSSTLVLQISLHSALACPLFCTLAFNLTHFLSCPNQMECSSKVELHCLDLDKQLLIIGIAIRDNSSETSASKCAPCSLHFLFQKAIIELNNIVYKFLWHQYLWRIGISHLISELT